MDDHEDQYRMDEEQQEVPQRARFLPRFLFMAPTAQFWQDQPCSIRDWLACWLCSLRFTQTAKPPYQNSKRL